MGEWGRWMGKQGEGVSREAAQVGIGRGAEGGVRGRVSHPSVSTAVRQGGGVGGWGRGRVSHPSVSTAVRQGGGVGGWGRGRVSHPSVSTAVRQGGVKPCSSRHASTRLSTSLKSGAASTSACETHGARGRWGS